MFEHFLWSHVFVRCSNKAWECYLDPSLERLSDDERVEEEDDAGDDGHGAHGEGGVLVLAGAGVLVVVDGDAAGGEEEHAPGELEDQLLEWRKEKRRVNFV